MVTSDEHLKRVTESLIVKKDPEEEIKKTLSERLRERFHERVYGKQEPQKTVD